MDTNKTFATKQKCDLINRVSRSKAGFFPAAKPVFTVCALIVFSVGTALLTNYSNQPGETGFVVDSLSAVEYADLALLRGAGPHSRDQMTILLFYHPHCPCTTATVRGLARLSTRISTSSEILAFAFCPECEWDRWTESPITKNLRRIPGTTIIVDREGEFCKKFGVMTSGHVLVYGADRKLVFSGGITASRGHEGDCQGSSQFLDRVNRKLKSPVTTPVYGCPIIQPGASQS